MSSKNKKIIAVLAAILIITASLAGCSTINKSKTNSTGSNTTGSSASDDTSSNSTEAIEASDLFTDRDMDPSFDESEAQSITLADNASQSDASGVTVNGNTVTISKEGIYIISGTLSDGQIIVEVDESDKVQLVLNGVSINNSSSAAIYVKSADKVFITTQEGTENILATTGEFVADGDTNIDGVIFAKDDITLNGSGTLTVTTQYGNGIVGKDDLKITGGTYDITVSNKGIEANDSVRIGGGTITVTSDNDSIHSDGDVYIQDGTLTLSSGDDGIHADAGNYIYGGTIDIIKSYEAIEGTTITIAGGNISAVSSDDGLNASSAKDSNDSQDNRRMSEFDTDENALITISGGTVYLDCEGDGIDSNGNVIMTGGEVYVAGPTSSGNGALDYNGSFSITGGTLLAVGSNGMAMNVSEATQGSILISFNGSYSGDITVTDSNGNEVLTYTIKKSFSSIAVSTPDLKKGETYTISIGDTYQTVTLDDYIYGSGSGMGMMMGGPKR